MTFHKVTDTMLGVALTFAALVSLKCLYDVQKALIEMQQKGTERG